jgi:hypothetical protein
MLIEDSGTEGTNSDAEEEEGDGEEEEEVEVEVEEENEACAGNLRGLASKLEAVSED